MKKYLAVILLLLPESLFALGATSLGIKNPGTQPAGGGGGITLNQVLTATSTWTASQTFQSSTTFQGMVTLTSATWGDASVSTSAVPKIGASGVTAGVYTSANITVDARGILSSAANGSGGGGGAQSQIDTSTRTYTFFVGGDISVATVAFVSVPGQSDYLPANTTGWQVINMSAEMVENSTTSGFAYQFDIVRSTCQASGTCNGSNTMWTTYISSAVVFSGASQTGFSLITSTSAKLWPTDSFAVHVTSAPNTLMGGTPPREARVKMQYWNLP